MNRCPTCDDVLRSALASCRKPACLAESNRADKVLDRWGDV